MPIYLVRWPDLSAALVKAGSEDELISILDEVANPAACTWSVYRGPLFLEFTLPAAFEVKEQADRPGPTSPEDVVVTDVSGLTEGSALEVAMVDSDRGLDMSEAIEKEAFPHVFKARHGREDEPSEAELREAVKTELQRLLQASWKLQHVKRRDDPVSWLAAAMDAPERLAQQWIEAANRDRPPDPKDGGEKSR